MTAITKHDIDLSVIRKDLRAEWAKLTPAERVRRWNAGKRHDTATDLTMPEMGFAPDKPKRRNP